MAHHTLAQLRLAKPLAPAVLENDLRARWIRSAVACVTVTALVGHASHAALALPMTRKSVLVLDTDRDGIPDHVEDANQDGIRQIGETDAQLVDSDGDGLPDGVEDANRDGLRQDNETDPRDHDTDGDRVSDGMERIVTNTDPLVHDTLRDDYRLVLLPEPMHFDLVRGLAARKGELEINTLWTASPAGLRFAPEIEYAVADGVGLEFEVPMHDLHAHGVQPYALKCAAQARLPLPTNPTWIHGAQTIVQTRLSDGNTAATLLWLVGAAPNRTFSFFAMVGVDVPLHSGHSRAIANPSWFFRASERWVFGLENNFAYAAGRPLEWLALPQIHWEPVVHFRIQLGAGPLVVGRVARPYLSGRVILEL